VLIKNFAMTAFVAENSIVRNIWGSADTILFVFAGASAEFALNKAVDWLYFTGRLPANPLERLFSTVAYSQKIVFASNEEALAAIDSITDIHKGVEAQRGQQIPAWAYRDVLFMLIDYSIRAYELLERPLTTAEKEEVFTVFYTIGQRMGIPGLPVSFDGWLTMRQQHLQQNLLNSLFTKHLYKQYKKHLGLVRYVLLRQVQVLLVPAAVRKLLPLAPVPLLWPVVQVYKLARLVNLQWVLKNAILPADYKERVRGLEVMG
jgi:hypothetical protein